MTKNYYDVLGIPKNSTQEQIKKAYRKLSLKYHPDKTGGDDTKFKELNEAYTILGDEQKRKEYDNPIRHSFMNSGGEHEATHEDMMKHIFKHFMGGGFHEPNVEFFKNGHRIFSSFMKPQTIQKTIHLTLKEAYEGISKPIVVERKVIDENKEHKTEKETIYVSIPKGVDNGEVILLKEEGHIVKHIKGHVRIQIRIEPNPIFKRDGLNLILIKTISLKQALCGFHLEIEHLNGKRFAIHNKPGNIINHDYVKTIPNLGMIRDKHIGSMIIQFKVQFPETIPEHVLEYLNKHL